MADGDDRDVVVDIGAVATGRTPSAGPLAAELSLEVGAQHPSTHGALRLQVRLDGEVITSAEPVVGFLHRGAEKLFEVRDYRQILVLANRHDWLSAFSSELGVVLAVEHMLGMEVPVRAIWARTLLAELNRVLSHLTFVGSYAVDGPAGPPAAVAFAQREVVQAVMEDVSGGRMHYMFNRIGGLKEDLPWGWTARARAATASVRAALPGLRSALLDDEAFAARSRGVGVLPPDVVHAYGVSGPIARASGVDLDLRRDEPYLAYGDLLADGVLQVVTRTEGDSYARYACLLDQVGVSLDLVEACLDRLAALPRGPVNVRLPKIVKAPEGSTYVWTENPLGINGYWLVSRGDRTPWRLKLRSASFNNVAALPHVLRGSRLTDLVPVLSSMFFVVGDIDK